MSFQKHTEPDERQHICDLHTTDKGKVSVYINTWLAKKKSEEDTVLIDLRRYYLSKEGQWYPTSKGFAMPYDMEVVNNIAKLASILTESQVSDDEDVTEDFNDDDTEVEDEVDNDDDLGFAAGDVSDDSDSELDIHDPEPPVRRNVVSSNKAQTQRVSGGQAGVVSKTTRPSKLPPKFRRNK